MADATFESLLTHTVSVQRRSYSSTTNDVYGIPTETISVADSTVKCLIQPLSDSLEFDVRGKKEMATKMGFFLISDSIEVDDIITYNSKQFIVIGVQDAAGQNHHRETFLRRLENE